MRFDLILRWVVVLSFIMRCLEVRAEVTYLSCSGTLLTTTTPEEPWNFSITVDTKRKTIMVDDYEPVPFDENPQSNKVGFTPSKPTNFGVSGGTLHRITGKAGIHIVGEVGGLWVARRLARFAMVPPH